MPSSNGKKNKCKKSDRKKPKIRDKCTGNGGRCSKKRGHTGRCSGG